jgi:hypothetical protein
VFKPVPENSLGLRNAERRKLVSASRGDEIDAVIVIPMLEAMLSFIMLMIAMRALPHFTKA